MLDHYLDQPDYGWIAKWEDWYQSRLAGGFGRGTATLVHGDQVFVAHEWVGIRLQCQQGIPLFCRYLQRRIQYANDIIIFTPSHHGIQCFHDS